MHALDQGLGQFLTARPYADTRQFLHAKEPADPAVQGLADGESVGQLDDRFLTLLRIVTQQSQLSFHGPHIARSVTVLQSFIDGIGRVAAKLLEILLHALMSLFRFIDTAQGNECLEMLGITLERGGVVDHRADLASLAPAG